MTVAAYPRVIADGIGLGCEIFRVIGHRDSYRAWSAPCRRAKARITDENIFPTVDGEGIARHEIIGERGEGDKAAIRAHRLLVARTGIRERAIVAKGGD